MTEEAFKTLISKYQEGTATPQERKIVETFFELSAEDAKTWPHHIMGDASEAQDRILKKINTTTKTLPSDRSVHYDTTLTRVFRHVPMRWAVAATILILIISGVLLTQYPTPDTQPLVSSAQIHPGANRATLTFANGTTINLSEEKEGIIVKSDHVAYDDGIAVELQAASHKSQDSQHHNTIKTPRGGQYHITLIDGTQVWLNAESSLSYPTAFATGERVVELTGEGYFEVVNNPNQPFRIIGGGLATTVLGTSFNIAIYPEEAPTVTVATGKVQVARQQYLNTTPDSYREPQYQTLTPNEQAVLNSKTGQLTKKKVDADDLIAWKSGQFRFNDTNIETIMHRVARWYDVDVHYENDAVRQLDFGGIISRGDDITALLSLMELTGTVTFEIENRTVIVKSK